jgi:hypothetical protein
MTNYCILKIRGRKRELIEEGREKIERRREREWRE